MPFAARSLAPALSCALALSAGPALAQAAPPERPPGHLRLIDKLDRPDDGYCLDIMGSGDHIRPDLPMTAHNCKPGLYADEAVRLEPDGRLYFPAYQLCATVAGNNGRALASTPLVPRRCGEKSPFLDADALQRFVHHPDGRVELRGSGLCLTAGPESDRTFEPTHRWRTLAMQRCHHADPKLSRWEFVVPKASMR